MSRQSRPYIWWGKPKVGDVQWCYVRDQKMLTANVRLWRCRYRREGVSTGQINGETAGPELVHEVLHQGLLKLVERYLAQGRSSEYILEVSMSA